MPQPTRASCRLTACLALAVLAAVLCAEVGCRGKGARAARRARAAEPRLAPVDRRVDHVPGTTLVFPVTIEGPIDPKRPLRVMLDDGRAVSAELFWINASFDAASGWLPSVGHWSATPAAAGARAAGAGSWYLIAAVPPSAIGQGLWLGRDRVPVNWLADLPPRVPDGSVSPWWPPPGVNTVPLGPFLDAESQSPLRRWRSRLVIRGLTPPPATPAQAQEVRPQPDDFPERALEELARQTEALWRVALARLWTTDQDLADRVKRRLVTAVDFGGGFVIPAWPVGQERLDSLRADLLNPDLTDVERADRARAWLDDQQAAAAWIIDDAGTLDAATGAAVVTAGVANLSDRTTLGWAQTDPPAGSPELAPVDPLSVRRLAVPSTRAAEDAPPGTRVEVHLGRWSVSRQAATEPFAVRPPGFRFEPFYADWTLDTWLKGSIEALAVLSEPADWATSALLFRDDARAGGAGWTLYIECKTGGPVEATPPRATGRALRSDPVTQSARAESLQVWLGPFERPRHVFHASSDEETRGAAGGTGVPVVVTKRADRWVCTIPLPADAIDGDGVVRLSMVRVDARGVRSAWPRPLLPWQEEPGRVALDTGAWSELGASPVGEVRPASSTRAGATQSPGAPGPR